MRDEASFAENSVLLEKLAASLTADDVALLEHLPYLLQDLWMLGGDPAGCVELLRGRLPEDSTVLDLACGKGAISICLAKELGLRVKGFDLLPAFIGEARRKAEENGVAHLCTFEVGDVNEVACTESGYDCVVFSAAGNILGEPSDMLTRLAGVVKIRGLVVLDESYLPDDAADGVVTQKGVQWQNYEYLTGAQWGEEFAKAGLAEMDRVVFAGEDMAAGNGRDMECIQRRAAELSEKYPDKKAMFAGYIKSQLDEVHDVENTLVNALWLLEKQPLARCRCDEQDGGRP